MYINLKEMPFSRYGSYFAFSHFINSHDGISGRDLYLRTVHGGEAMKPLMKTELLYQGKTVDFKENTAPHLLCLNGDNGSVKICIPQPKIIRIKGNHAGLKLSFEAPGFKSAYPYQHRNYPETPNTAEPDHGNSCNNGLRTVVCNSGGSQTFHYEINAYSHKLMLTPIKGTIEVDAPWNGTGCSYVRIDLLPDEKGELECALEEYSGAWIPKVYTDSFEDCLKTVKESFDEWLGKTLPVPEEYEETRELAAYLNWSSVVEPSGHIKRDTMLMSKNWMNNVWSWDYCFNAMALAKTNPKQAWSQFMYLPDYQDKDGVIPDCLNDVSKIFNFVKPPIQGWALSWILDRTDFVTDEMLGQLYPPLCKWTGYWLKLRDCDNDGLPEYYHGNDSGWDNSTIFKDSTPITSPDLAAFLILQTEALAKTAQRLGFAEEAGEWDRKSSGLLKNLLNNLWTGRRFTARHGGDHKMIESDSLITYLPILLGRRLPEEVLARLINDLKNTDMFLTGYGFATEKPAGRFYEADGYWRGPIWAPSTLLLVDGLTSAGEKELAGEAAVKFCNMVKQSGMAENFNALTGEGLRDRAYTWTSSVFLILANEYI